MKILAIIAAFAAIGLGVMCIVTESLLAFSMGAVAALLMLFANFVAEEYK
jgi:hypothetical protein